MSSISLESGQITAAMAAEQHTIESQQSASPIVMGLLHAWELAKEFFDTGAANRDLVRKDGLHATFITGCDPIEYDVK